MDVPFEITEVANFDQGEYPEFGNGNSPTADMLLASPEILEGYDCLCSAAQSLGLEVVEASVLYHACVENDIDL